MINDTIRQHSLDLRVSFLPEKVSEDDQMLIAKRHFLQWVAGLIHESKLPTFNQIFSNENGALITNIKRELSRVFYGQRLDSVSFGIESQKQDFEAYRKDSLKDWAFFRNNVFDRLFFSPNDVILIYGKERLNPELHLIKFENLKEFETKENSNVLTKVVFDTKEGEFLANEEGYFLNDTLIYAHDLGFCPCTFIFPSEPSEQQQSSPLSPFVGNLKKLQFFRNSKDVADLVAPYPIITKYKSECSTEGCTNGILESGNSCQSCKASSLVGAGSVIEVPVPYDSDPVLLEAVKFITVDTNSLEYISKANRDRSEGLFFSIVGITEEIRKEAMNEAQIQASFDSRENTLRRFASTLEKAHKFCLLASAGLRYGVDAINELSFSYGFFFFNSELDLTEEAQKKKILEAVIPFYNIELEELVHFKEVIPATDLLLRLKYESLLARFESENGSLLKFGSLNPQNRDRLLRETFLSYIEIPKENNNDASE